MGVTRGLIMELAAAEGIAISECELKPDDLAKADELMLTSTLREELQVVAVDERTIGAGTPGPMTRRLLALFWQRALEMVSASD
jgi:branched-subunit amino acid aminotransferase/4-amino-4-deoxychorismate lyase